MTRRLMMETISRTAWTWRSATQRERGLYGDRERGSDVERSADRDIRAGSPRDTPYDVQRHDGGVGQCEEVQPHEQFPSSSKTSPFQQAAIEELERRAFDVTRHAPHQR